MIIWLACILQSILEPSQISLETSFDTNVHVDVSITYPKLANQSELPRYVNETLRQEAITLHNDFVEEMREPVVELWEEDIDERMLSYSLHLVYNKPHLLEFYGHKYRYTGGAHGGVSYITKVFWQNGDDISELALDNLFVPNGRDILYRYCSNYFKENRWGYYSDDDMGDWDPFQPEHLDAFLLTDKGLLLIFQNYTVCGLMDEPITLLIHYDKIASIAKPDGVLTLYLRQMSSEL